MYSAMCKRNDITNRRLQHMNMLMVRDLKPLYTASNSNRKVSKMGRYRAFDRDTSFDEAFRCFEEAKTWETANLYLFEFRELLLSVKALSRVKQRIAESSAQGDTSSVFYWQLQLTWLKEAKEYGIQRAWIRIMKR